MRKTSELTLILGGARSGKSRHAEELAHQQSRPVLYVATCRSVNLDTEMQARIERHRADRPSHWQTVENCFDLKTIFASYPQHLVLLDCLTLWLGHQSEVLANEAEILAELENGWEAMHSCGGHAIVVSNEVGMGIVPEYADVRAFRDLCGRANQLTARIADRVSFMVAGLPLKLK